MELRARRGQRRRCKARATGPSWERAHSHIPLGRPSAHIVIDHWAAPFDMLGWDRICGDLQNQREHRLASLSEHPWQVDGKRAFTDEQCTSMHAFLALGRPIPTNTVVSCAEIGEPACDFEAFFLGGQTAHETSSTLLTDHFARIGTAIGEQWRCAGDRLRALVNPLVICPDPEGESWQYEKTIVVGAAQGEASCPLRDVHARLRGRAYATGLADDAGRRKHSDHRPNRDG
jgi:dimethylsulfone monooxygenase